MTVRRLVQRPQARRDILSIVDHIAGQNPGAAAAVFDAYVRALERLRDHPETGRRYVPRHPQLSNVRALPLPGFPSYLIFTIYDGTTVDILRVLHGARDIIAILDS